MSDDPYHYARKHDAGPGAWCVRGPDGFEMYVPDMQKDVAYVIGKILSGKYADAKAMLDALLYERHMKQTIIDGGLGT